MSAKAIQYAEETLGVHSVFEETVSLTELLDNLCSELDKAQDKRRYLEEDYADREVELIGEMRGVHPNMSDTRFKTELKGWERLDADLKSIRTKLLQVRGDIQGLEYDIDLIKLRIRVGAARLEELGGYFNYLAAVKNQADKGTKTTQGVSE